MVSDSKMLLLLILGMVRDQLSEEETIEYLSRVFTIEEIEESDWIEQEASSFIEDFRKAMQ